MTRRALLSALGLWSREPRALLTANGLFALLMALVLLASSLAPFSLVAAVAGVFGIGLFLGLIRVLRSLDNGEPASVKRWGRMLPGAALASLPSIALLLGAAGTSALAPQGWPAWVLLPLAAWSALGALLSLGLAAPEGQPWWAAVRAGMFAAIAFLPAALAALAIGSWLSGFWALWLGPKQFGASILWAPLLLAPLFTPSFYAAYLYFLAQGIKDRSQGRPALEGAPTLKEILRPWR